MSDLYFVLFVEAAADPSKKGDILVSLTGVVGLGASKEKRNVLVFPPSATYLYSLKELKLHFRLGVVVTKDLRCS